MNMVLALAIAAGFHLAPDETVIREPDKIVPIKKQVMYFGEKSIEAAVTGPSARITVARPKTKHRNLIELRASFRPELLKSSATLPGQ